MRQVTATGQTVEDAVRSALEQLNTSRDQVNVEIIDEGKKGFLGVFGSKKAIVKVMMVTKAKEESSTETSGLDQDAVPPQELETEDQQVEAGNANSNAVEDAIQETKEYLQQVAGEMGASIEVSTKRKSKEVYFVLEGDKIALLIGKRGQTLNALQSLAQLVINRDGQQYLTAIVDAENYRERRKDTLSNLAKRLADKAVRTQKEVALESMPSYERKIIHAALQHNKQVSTYSDGSEPHRHVVIKPE